MAYINDTYLDLQGSYLFAEVQRRVSAFKTQCPEASLIRMGIGDVTKPLVPVVIEAMHRAVDEMADSNTFRGYGPEQGYDFLVQQILRSEYQSKGISLEPSEIFVSDGCKSDMGNIGDILSDKNIVAVTDPVYPVYVDTNVMAGRAGSIQANGFWSKLVYLPCNAENGFVPELPKEHVDVMYLCFPNNPTGTTLTRDQLKVFVDYALKNNVLILFDAAYEAFISESDVPRSIYEIEGAQECAIEFRSFSKSAGFTGIRCGYTVVPKKVCAYSRSGKKEPLQALWNRRQTTKFNGVSYVTQRAAEAALSDEGKRQTSEQVAYYMEHANLIRSTLEGLGWQVFGGVNAPYVWFKAPEGLRSCDFFDRMLREIHVIATPGVGFGPSGEGYLRLTAFADTKSTQEAMARVTQWKR